MKKSISADYEEFPAPIELQKMDSALSEEQLINYKWKMVGIFKLYLTESVLDKNAFIRIKSEIDAHEIVCLTINKFFDENEEKFPDFIRFFWHIYE